MFRRVLALLSWGVLQTPDSSLSLGLQVPSEKVFGVGLEGPNTF